MGSVEDQREMTLQSSLVRHPKDPLLPWHDSTKLLRQCEGLILSLGSTTPVIPDSPMSVGTPHFVTPARRGNYFGAAVWRHRNKIGGHVGGWPHGPTVCLCEQQSSIHLYGLSPFLPVDGVVPIAITSDYHSWVFCTSPS